jgi:hypothetical protein
LPKLKNINKLNFILYKKKNKLVDFGSPLRKCAYQAFIIQNLDVVTLELDMKVQFANFDKLNILKYQRSANKQ